MIVSDVRPSVVLLVVMGALIAVGVYLLLERSLTRVLIGVACIGNGVNLLVLVAGGAAGAPPLIGASDEPMSDPLPQALILTAIVITLGFTAFILAMAYRSWQLSGHDEIQDDVEDRRIARRAERGDVDARSDESSSNAALEAAQVRDETEDDEVTPATGSEADRGGAGSGGTHSGGADSEGADSGGTHSGGAGSGGAEPGGAR